MNALRGLSFEWLRIQLLLLGGAWLACGPRACGWVAIALALLGIVAGATKKRKADDGPA